jgi:hypothetical protein
MAMVKLSSIKHKGLRTYRFKFNDNPMERVFAEAWVEENRVVSGNSLLDHLLAEDPNRPRGEVSQRDATVAATVIQWLGSPVGQCFLQDVVEKSHEKA